MTSNVLLSLLLLNFAGSAYAAVRYVDAMSAAPMPPYTNWATAAASIQVAVDAAAVGDEIVVTNGTYATGGRAVGASLLTNRVSVDKPLTLRSVNGPQFTIIQGVKAPGGGNGDGAIRCVYLADGTRLAGFTLTNGATRSQGDDAARSGGGAWCASTKAVLTNCVLVGNSAEAFGGGAYSGLLYECTLATNSAGHSGGGAAHSSLNNCTLKGNSASSGGGTREGTLNNCALSGNWARGYAGGAWGGTLNNCTLTGNSAESYGGGAAETYLVPCTLNNCTLTGNSAYEGGGISGGTLKNCIVYFNTASVGANYTGGGLNYCCTTPDPGSGVGNITFDPQLASASHLSAASPCRGAGGAAYATGNDIDGETWATPPSIGCDEYHARAAIGPLSVGIIAMFTNVAVGLPLQFRALIDGRTTASSWEFGDGVVVSNQPYATHAWRAPGDYAVVLRVYNESQPEGVSAAVAVRVLIQLAHYVAVDSANPVPPYTSWATAATSIQDAVDAAAVGGEVVVSNGVYATGGRAVVGNLTNRVAVTKPLTLRSVNGLQFTIIQGAQAPGGGQGDGAIRCVYLTEGARLSGFTMTNGATRDWDGGGGVWCASTNAIVSNCLLTGNSGGGVCRGTLKDCTLSGNAASGSGGGAYLSVLNDCVLTGNAAQYGGGAAESTLNNCTLSGNSSGTGGGVMWCVLNNCTLTDNAARGSGGGAAGGTLNNCILSGNSSSTGGGAAGGTLNHCTVTGNSAFLGGGVSDLGIGGGITLSNCIVYYNTAPVGANYTGWSSLNYCCTTPLPEPAPGQEPFVGNLGVDPQLANASHLSAASPCRGAGSAADATGNDIDGEAWATPPSIGCDEFHAGAVTGPLSVRIAATFTTVAVFHPLRFTALIDGRTTASVWDFGDGLMATNQPYATHAWTAPGDYAVVLRACNESQPEGVSATVTIHVLMQPVHYVAVDSANPVPPYTSWATAATSIQDAVDAAAVGGEVVVSNGVYATGGRAVVGNLTNRVAVTKPLTLRSVNGLQFTIIQGAQAPGGGQGDGAIRCVYLTDSARLSGFMLTNGSTRDWDGGGGVWCESTNAIVTNCRLTGNSGGGVYGGTLNNCALTGNADGGAVGSTLNNCALTGNSGGGTYGNVTSGGGAQNCTLNNCTLTDNENGGAFGCTLNNCIVYFNTTTGAANYAESTLNFCCTTPLPLGGAGNINLDPQLAGAWRLSSGSPCRGAGNAAYATGADIDGEAWASPPSIGCDEYHTGVVTGPLSVDIRATFTNVAVGQPVEFTALIEGRTSASVWEFGDGLAITNRPYAIHAWTAPGDYTVILRVYNESLPAGIDAMLTIHVVEVVHYVAIGSKNPLPPYTSWATAATNIQHAVDAAKVPGALVLVSNGVYATGGRALYGTVNTRVVVDKPLKLQSVNGTQVTVIEGYQTPGTTNGEGAMRCVYLGDGASLSGFTLTNGATPSDGHGGGVWCASINAVVSNCVMVGNSASWSGGGAYGGTLNNCALRGNSARLGGGAGGEPGVPCTLNDCTLVGNRAIHTNAPGMGGGGAYYCTLNRCTVMNNSAVGGGGGVDGGTLNACTLTDNSASCYGGGAAWSTLNNCTLTGNLVSGQWNSSGGGAYGCTLNNCTLTGNRADSDGGGAAGGTLNNCTLTDNSARSGGGARECTLNHCTLAGNRADSDGGGAAMGTLNNCTLTDNSARGGGGASGGTLNNCTLTGNLASYYGGGASVATLNNCIVYFNVAPSAANYYQDQYWGALNYCCTTPLPTNSVGNITNAPLFVDYAGGNLRLQSKSPCINAGLNAYAPDPTDMDGNPRIASGTVDIGAFEFQGPGSVISYAWLQHYGLPTDGSADATDSDADGHSTSQEWRCQTDPTNAISALRLLSAACAGTNVTVSWQSVEGLSYFLERSTNLAVTPSFSLLATNLPGQPGTTSYTDTNAATLAPLFYRVRVGD